MMFRDFAGLSHVHFVGVGGAGMSGIAELLLDYDLSVSGSDLSLSDTTSRLSALGVDVKAGHDPAHVEGADIVVISSAVPPDNPEVVAAREAGIPIVRRAEMLAEMMRLKYGIAVAGSHGKTTTTSLVGLLLTEGGLDPTVIVGGRLRVTGTGARHGRSDYLVAEADEYDRSFLRLAPIIAVLTCIDVEHLDTYRDLGEIREAFLTFAQKVPCFGQVIACTDDANVRGILPELSDHRVVGYGLEEGAEIRAVDLDLGAEGSSFTVISSRGGEGGRIELPIPGAHNVRNALAAIAVGLGLGLEVERMAEALAGFGGVHRRFERLGSWRGATVIDDYAHHPTEVRATLEAARQVFPGSRIHAVFQPHLYSRTRAFAADFGAALLGADDVFVTDVYASREEPVPGVTGELVAAAAREAGHENVHFCADWRQVEAELAPQVREGDAVLTLGAGDIYLLARTLAERGA
ncbi:MAG: UDP-N-acetylmuramate--L-alanine ligase [Thermoanaerobaculia bacterium]|nr:UDP-N-acetylmuramate--L-alanine ligase [Thermoanaerobaculia bacterium]